MALSIAGLVQWRGEFAAGVGSQYRFIPPGGGGSTIRFTRKESFVGLSSIRFSRKEEKYVLGGGGGDDVSTTRWPAAAAAAPPSPWLVLPPSLEKETEEICWNFYMVAENRVVKIKRKTKNNRLPPANIVGSSHGWLALDFKGRQILWNPLTCDRIILPSIESLPVVKKDPDFYLPMRKLILSCSPDDEDEDCIAMMSYDLNERLAFCRLSPRGSGPTEWTPIGKPFIELDDKTFERNYRDFVYSAKRKLFFCVTDHVELEAWDLRDPHSPPKMILLRGYLNPDKEENHPFGSVGKLDECELKEMYGSKKCLVICEQTDQLFLVRRYIADRKPAHYYTPTPPGFPYHTVSFDVYEIDIEKRELKYMEDSLNGLAMFVGLNHGFAIKVEEGGLINPDSIYFTDAKENTPNYWDDDPKIGGHDIGVFDYAKRDFYPCYNYPIEKRTFSTTLRLTRAASGADKIKRIVPPPVWFTPSSSADASLSISNGESSSL